MSQPSRIRHAIHAAAFLLLTTSLPLVAEGAAESTPVYSDRQPAGVYSSTTARSVVVVRWGSSHYLIDRTDGTARRLDPASTDPATTDRYTFGPARSTAEPVAGRVTFERADDGTIAAVAIDGEGFADGRYERHRYPFRNFLFETGSLDNGEATLAGTLIEPLGASTGPTVLFLGGQGPDDRYTMFVFAAGCLEAGLRVVVYDQRGAGLSEGPDETTTMLEYSSLLADDAVAVADHVRRAMPAAVAEGFAVWGHSTGGFIAPRVAKRLSHARAVINLAGNQLAGWRQWRYRLLAGLVRSGFDEPALTAAERYLDAFFGAGLGTVAWDDYREHLAAAEASPWFDAAGERSLVRWESEEQARRILATETYVPADDLRGLGLPVLGLFFEHDHSTPPESAAAFLDAALDAGADVTVRRYPGLNHGLWEVESLASPNERITRRSPEPGRFAVEWLLGLTD